MDLFNKVRNAILEGREQIDELSKDTLKSYAGKAFDQSNSILKSRNLDLPNSVKKAAEVAKERRRKGIVSAGKRLGDDEMRSQSAASANRIVYNKEEAEQIDEISTEKATAYVKKAESQPKRAKSAALAIEKIRQRHAQVPTTEEVEELDELSKDTMGSYINKAAQRIGTQGITAGLKIAADEKSSKNFKNMGKREKGIATAVKKLTREEAEEIAETKKYEFDVSGEYGNKAADRFVNLAKKKGIDAKVHTYNGPGGGNPVVHLAHSDHTVIHKFLKKHYDPHMSHDEIERHRFDEAVKNPYAVGMAAAMKSTGDKPPLKKSTIIKAHDIAKGIEAKEDVDKGLEDELMSQRQGESGKTWRVQRAGKTIGSYDSKDKADVKAMKHPLNKVVSAKEEVELEEGRGRPPKVGSEAWKRAQTERKKDPAEHIINRMGQAATNMTGGQHITYDDGKVHRVGNNLAARTLAHYRGLKPAEKEVFQKKIAKSHQDHLDALGGK